MTRIFSLLLLSVVSAFAAQTEFVFLVTGDGIRHQEVFTGVDPKLMTEEAKESSGVQRVAPLRKKYWAETAQERREKLMPFFWKELSKEGVIYGNLELGSAVVCRNPHWFSYPGYAEILNGGPVPSVTSNDSVFSPRETVLEFVRRKFELKASEVAAFGSWEVFNWITMRTPEAIFCNAGYESMEAAGTKPSERTREWNKLQFEILSPWDSVRYDAVTLGLALEYIPVHKPKVVYLALGETDDWAHDRRYDRMVQSLAYFDDALRKLWTMIQSTEPYRGKSALIVTTDHGRGRTGKDWTSHGKDVPGADEAWLAVFGPGVLKSGEMKNSPIYSLSNVAATMLNMLGVDPQSYDPNIAPAVAEVLGAKSAK